MDYKTLLNSSNKLDANKTKKLSEIEIDQLRKLAGTTTTNIRTTLYCIHNSIKCALCEVCSSELEVENFVVGFSLSKRFCSTKCKASFDNTKSSSGVICPDYSLLLDKNGNPSSGKMDRHLNSKTILDMKEKTGLDTDDINTLLYFILNKEKTVKECAQCDTMLKIDSFPAGYRDNQNYCSIECKDSNYHYRDNLRKGKFGISRFDNEAYMKSRMIPWFEQKQNETLEEFGSKILTTLEEYTTDKKTVRFECQKCNFIYTNDLSYNRNLHCKICNPASRQQTEIAKFIQGLGFDVEVDTRRIVTPFEIDVYVPSKKIGIEYDGFYWHGDYENSKKFKIAEEIGVKIIKVFEDEFKNSKDIVFSRIKSILGVSQNKIYARKCVVKEVSFHDSKKFFNQTHIQGTSSSSIQYGLYDSGEKLVACMSFGKPRFSSKYDFELHRYSSLLDTTVVGGASKLMEHFKRNHENFSMVSYCDIRYGTGNMYEKIGFKLSHITQPGYFYYKKGIRHNRMKFQKHKLEGLLSIYDQALSEYSNMRNNGYEKIWDLGNLVYEYLT